MDKDKISKKVYLKAKALFESGITDSTLTQKTGKVAQPIAIHKPGGEIEAWFVGIVVGDKLVGFIRLKDDLTVLGYSSFQRNPNSTKECPNAKSWLDSDTILQLARTVSPPDAHLEKPLLSYDQHPDRIAWAVRTTGEHGEEKLIFVAGELIYLRNC